MPEAIGENVPVEFICFCCRQPVQIWSFVPVHPDSSNTELLPDRWRQPYRQHWYVNERNNRLFDSGQLWQINWIDFQPNLIAVDFTADDNPYVAGLVRILPEGVGRGRVVWTCPPCTRMADRDRTMLWSYIQAALQPSPSY